MASTSSYDADASSSTVQTSDLLSAKPHKAPKRDLSSLNAELKSHGWSKRSLHLSGLDERETNEVIGIMYEMIGSAISNVENLDALASRYRTMEYEQDRTAKALSLSRTAQRKSEGDAAGWKMRVTDLERRLAMEEAKTKELREDVSRARKAVEAVRIAASQDQRKAQTRYEAAQARIAKYAADSSLLSGAQGMTVLNPIAPGRPAPVAFGQAALLEQSLRDLTEIREAVQQENEDFRHVVVSAGNALRQALAMAQGEKEASRLHPSQFFTLTPQLRASPYASLSPDSSPTYPEIADIRLKTLIASLSSVLASRIIRVPTSDPLAPILSPEEAEARARAERDEQKRTQDLLDRMKDLQVEVECARQRELEAKKTMEEVTNRQMAASMAKAGEREKDAEELLGILKERERLEGERRAVRGLKEGYERERKAFEAERKAFQEERRRVDVDSILAQLPGTPSHSATALSPIAHIASMSASPLSVEAGSDYASSSTASSSTSSHLADASSSASASSSSPSRSRHDHSPRRQRPQVQSQPQAAWHAHQPSSPSPLSPHRPRTPKPHLAGLRGKRVRTPLSRLVLEKAARKSSSDDALAGSIVKLSARAESSRSFLAAGPAAVAAETKVMVAGVKALGEGGRKANTDPSTTAVSASGVGASVKGKGRLMGSASAASGAGEKKKVSPTSALGSSTVAKARIPSSGSVAASKLGSTAKSQAGVGALVASQGAAAGKGKPVWR